MKFRFDANLRHTNIEAFHGICTTPPKFFLDVAQTFSAGLVGSTDTQEAFGPLRNPKMSSQELPERTNPPKSMIFLAFSEKNGFSHISVSF